MRIGLSIVMVLFIATLSSKSFSGEDITIRFGGFNVQERSTPYKYLESGVERPAAVNPSLFSTEEFNNIEIGQAIALDRLEKNWARYLQTEMLGRGNFKKVIGAEKHDVALSIFNQFTNLYGKVGHSIQSIIDATTSAEKNQRQRELYCLLLLAGKRAKHFHTADANEDMCEEVFCEMIAAKACGNAMQQYGEFDQYVAFIDSGQGGALLQVDNKGLYEHYKAKHTGLINKFKRHPIFALDGGKNTKITKIVDQQTTLINTALGKCGNDTLAITNHLGEVISQNDVQSRPIKGDSTTFFTDMFQTYIAGPDSLMASILKAIQDYQAISKRIKNIKVETDTWLNAFTTDKNFRNFPVAQRDKVNSYLRIVNNTQAKGSVEQKGEDVAIVVRPPRKSKVKKEESGQQSAAPVVQAQPSPVSMPAPEHVQSPLMEATITPSSPVPAPHPLPEPEPEPQPKKVKTKTRPQQPVQEATLEADVKAEVTTPALPAQFDSPEFKGLIEELVNERDQRQLLRSFKQLFTDYDVFSENYEKNNKGYFAVRSPITGKIHVRTYHHLHDQENPYASIFIALKDVLRDAGFR